MNKQKLSQIKNKPYLYFCIKIGAFFLLIFGLDFIIGSTLRYFYFNQESGAEYRATYVMQQADEELLVFGSSRALHHYQSTILEDRMKLTTYNAGRNGNPILYHLAIFKSVIKRYHPRLVILDININEFQKIEGSYDVLSTLLPYYKSHPEVRSIVKLKSNFEQLKLCSQIYPYNSLMFTIAAGNIEFNKQRREDINGYMLLNNTWKKRIELENKFPVYEVDSVKIDALKTFINRCKENNIGLVLVFSPYFKMFQETNNSIVIAKEIASKNKIRFIDFTNDERFITKPKYFADYTHLNDEGATLFTNIMVDSLMNVSVVK
jgi:hypothetical protein